MILSLLGIDKYRRPEDPDINIMVNYMRKYLVTYRPEEFVTAFELLVAGKLDIDPQTIKSLSSIHLVNVMQGYTRYNINKRNPMQLNEQNELTQEEKDRIMYRSSLDIFNRLQVKRVMAYEFHWSIFNYFSRMGVLKFSQDNKDLLGKVPGGEFEVVEATETILQNARMALNESFNENGTMIMGDMIMHRKEKCVTDIQIRQKARGLAVREYFMFLLVNDYNLKDILS